MKSQLISRYHLILVSFLFFGGNQNRLMAQAANSEVKGYGKATYNISQAGKFMRTWLISGPFSVSSDTTTPSREVQEKVFKTDVISNVPVSKDKPVSAVPVNGKNFKWQLVLSADDIVNLDKVYTGKDFVYGYALAEIIAPDATSMVLALGSDDGIKVWLNGKQVHENWIPRGTNKDEDLVQLKLVKGSNQLLFKIQDIEGGWSFVARMLDKTVLTETLNKAAGNGNLDNIRMLLDAGTDVNAVSKTGISPIMSAKVSGRDEVVKLLLDKGAKNADVLSGDLLADNFYASLKGKEGPGIAVLVARDGNILYRKGFGSEDIKNKIAVTPDTKFRIGSVTKQFTAAAILKLQEQGLLTVNDKLSKFMPGFPRGDEVTIHQLLTHTSGIHSYTGKDDFIDKVTKIITPDSLINYFKNDPYDFNPGEKMLYNNSGYFLLGYIIGKVSGKPYDVYLKETFFTPLGMTNTGVHHAGIKLEHQAKGYTKNNEKWEEALDWDMSWAGGAGAIYSTVDDLLKWNLALYGGKVINEQSLQQALTPATVKSGATPSMRYGYGLGLNNYRGQEIISHSGGLHGFVTQLAWFPKEKLTVVMFSNTAEPEVNFEPTRIAEAFLWNKMDKQDVYREIAVKPADLQVYTGRFEMPGTGVITVTTADGRLYAQLTGQSKFEIFASATDEFFWKVVEAKIKFSRDDKGAITQATIFQNGREMKAVKLPEEKIVAVNAAILDSYTGNFKLNNDITVAVTNENGRLFAHPTGQDKVEMLPLSETDFVIKEVNAKVSFVKGGNDKVDLMKLTMNGTTSELPRMP